MFKNYFHYIKPSNWPKSKKAKEDVLTRLENLVEKNLTRKENILMDISKTTTAIAELEKRLRGLQDQVVQLETSEHYNQAIKEELLHQLEMTEIDLATTKVDSLKDRIDQLDEQIEEESENFDFVFNTRAELNTHLAELGSLKSLEFLNEGKYKILEDN